MNANIRDKFRGVLLGMACGDALGAQVEFKARGTFPYQSRMTGAGPHNLQPGQWTDDTAMALLLAEHLMSDPTVENRDLLAKRWIRWWRDGVGSCTGKCFDIGNQTALALSAWERRGVAPAFPAQARGNGAIMRTAPVALAHLRNPAYRTAAALSQAMVTHPGGCGMLCTAFCDLLADAAQQAEPEGALVQLRTAHGNIFMRHRSQVESTGYDVHTYEAAIWCVLRANDAKDAICRAVNLGDDADTVGAVTGALAGAVWGADALPVDWIGELAWRDRIVDVADWFAAKYP